MKYKTTDHDGIMTLDRPGEGMPLVILPGVMADAKAWMPVADAIDLNAPVCIVNRRGRVPSLPIGENYGVSTEVEDLAAVLKSIAEPVHLLGWSYGGLIALEGMLAGLPISSLILYEPVSRPFAPEAVEPIRLALSQGDFDRAVEIVNCAVSGFDLAYVDALRKTPVWSDLCRLSQPLASELSAISRFEPHYASYERIDHRVTLILGEENKGRAPYGAAFERFAQSMPAATVKLLPGQGHLAHVTHPLLLAQVIAQTIRQRDAADGA